MLSFGLSGGPWAAAKVYSINCAGTEVGKPLTYALITNGSQVALFEVQEGSAAPLTGLTGMGGITLPLLLTL